MIIGIDASRALVAQATGTERYSQEIIRHLLNLPEAADHQWRLYVGDEPPPALFPSNPHTHIRILRAGRLWTHTVLARELVRHPPDVVFIPAHVIPFLPPVLLPPTVVTIHDLGHRYFPQAHTRFQRLYLELSTRWSGAVARRIIAVSRYTAGDLVRFLHLPEAKIQVIYEALACGKSNTQEEEARCHPQRSYALYLGTIQPRKNLARLIQAYARLVERYGVEWDLVLAGKQGWLSDQLYGIATNLGITERVHFPGYVPEAQVEHWLSNALFFAFPSLFEGFGLPVLEAQAMGVPVMCANQSALPEVAGDAAILVDPSDVEAIADAMLRLSRDEALRQNLIIAGYENVKRFSWKKAAQETLAVLEAAARSR